MSDSKCDAFVFFGASGDLAYKKIFPALQSMVKRGTLDVPVIGVANSNWDLAQLHARMHDSLQEHGGIDKDAFGKLTDLLGHYIRGDYADAATFTALKQALGRSQRPAYYLAIPPSLFGTVIEQLSAAGCAPPGARVIVEKPFGRNLETARELNRILLGSFAEQRIFRIDHYLGKRPVQNLVFFRLANSVQESIWNREHIESIQITMAESFGLKGRGSFYDQTGAIRDVIQNHLFQVLSNLLMEPPARTDSESIRDEKVKVLKSVATLRPEDVIRGQFRGYRNEPGVAQGSEVETFAAVRLTIDNWRWQGVPIFIRAGKALATTCTEVVARLRRPPSILHDDLMQNYLRFRINPTCEIGLGLSVLDVEGAGSGEKVELLASRFDAGHEREAYERVLSDALTGDRTLFAREDYVEEAWRIVDPVLKAESAVYPYEPGSWGPKQAGGITPPGGWRDPVSPAEPAR